MGRLLRGALALAVLATAAGCRRSPPPASPARPNVVLVSIDTLRADRLGCYGYAEAETPAIDGLARAGTLFRRAYSPVPLTLPAHATLFTGLEPPAHGLVDNGLTAIDLGAPTLAERLQAAGYDTAAFVAAFVLNRVFGLDRGFRHYDDGPPGETELSGVFHGVADARERLDAALAWLSRPRTGPFFLFLHLYDVHAPHVAPERYAQRFASRPYDGEVSYVDAQVRRLLDVLEARKLASDTLVVLTADHGESLGDHGEATHGIFVYDATLHVPLIVRWPGAVTSGRVIEGPVGLADVAPTILDLLGLPPAPAVQGRALLGSAAGASDRALWAESDYPARHYGWARLRSLRQDGFKYIDAPRPELYDVARDPAESQDLARQDPGRAARMAAALDSMESRLQRTRAAEPAGPDAAARGRLAALGYATGAPPPGPGLDPKDGMPRLRGLDDAAPALERGGAELEHAERRYRELAAEFPGQGHFHLGLGRTLESQGRFAEAEAAYREAARRDDVRIPALARLVALAARRGDAAAEVQAAESLVGTTPRHAASRRILADALARAGDVTRAEAAYRESLRLNPASRSARWSWARFLVGRGRLDEADAVRAELDREQPGDPESEKLLELRRARAGRPEVRGSRPGS